MSTYKTNSPMPNVRIYPDTTHQTRLSLEAQDFREAYQLTQSPLVQDRSRQRNLITEEFKEFLEAEAMLYLTNPKNKEDCLKELADFPSINNESDLATHFPTALDEDNMEGFVRMLDMIKTQFKSVVLISHLDSLKDCVDSELIIEKKNGYAYVSF